MLIVVMLNVVILSVIYAECRKQFLMLSVIKLNVIMLSVTNKSFTLSSIRLNVVKADVIMLNVVAPKLLSDHFSTETVGGIEMSSTKRISKHGKLAIGKTRNTI
jgi:hypothetical protein